MTDYSGLVILPSVMRRIRQLSDALELDVQLLDRDQIIRQIERGDIDAAIGGHFETTLQCERTTLFSERFVCIASSVAPVASGGHLTIEDYVSLDHVVFRSDREPQLTSAVDQALALLGLKRNIKCYVAHISSITLVAAQTNLIATISERIARKFEDSAMIAIMEFPIPTVPSFDVDFVCSDSVRSDPGLQWLRDTVIEAVDHIT